MENFDITQVPNSVLIGASLKELYFWLIVDEDHGYRNRIEMLNAVTGEDEEKFYKLFHGRYFYILEDVEVCNIAINFLEFMLKNDVTLRRETLQQTLKVAEKEENNSPEIENLKREEFLLWRFDAMKAKALKEIMSIAKILNNPQNPNIYVFDVTIFNDPLVISDSSVVRRDKTNYIEGNEKWAEIDKRLDALKRELSTIVQDGV